MKAMPRSSPRTRKKRSPDYKDTIARLKAAAEEINKPRHRKKGRDVLERTPKEIADAALADLCVICFNSTGYDARWLRYALEEYWQAGRSKLHSYEKRLSCCQLIHCLKAEGISERQAMVLTNQAYGFNKTDAKDSYYFFRRDLQKYYFPEIRFKAHIRIRVILDALQHGRVHFLIVPGITQSAHDKFKEIINSSFALLRLEIQRAQKKKLEKSGVMIAPSLKNLLGKDFKNGCELVQQIQKILIKRMLLFLRLASS